MKRSDSEYFISAEQVLHVLNLAEVNRDSSKKDEK